ncbi:MAG TPA: PHP domain-containing protein [Candidatus Dormibacteraeota bacterium]|nr:PHP domain-containing protein [Candidatus Dormibacteraeota bacterium]
MSVASAESSSPQVLADLHVHSEFSWDAPRGAMVESCRRAVALGLKVVAFTDHADYSELAGGARLDLTGYLEALAYCRRAFPRLSVWSGVELGEPHRFPMEAAILLRQGHFDLVLGSLHSIIFGNSVLELSEPDRLHEADPTALMRTYFEELLRLLEGPVDFEVLTHFEYLKRFWLAGWPPYHSEEYQPEIRAVLEAAARRDVVLELNTTRGGDPARALCPSPVVIEWWREAGGHRLSLGSDAHDPSTVAAGFELAGELARACGFVPSTARVGLWTNV